MRRLPQGIVIMRVLGWAAILYAVHDIWSVLALLILVGGALLHDHIILRQIRKRS